MTVERCRSPEGGALLSYEPLDDLADVGALVQFDRAVGVVLDLNPEQVLHGALVGDLPSVLHCVHELVVRAAIGAAALRVELRRVDDLQVVDVDADGEGLNADVANSEPCSENSGEKAMLQRPTS